MNNDEKGKKEKFASEAQAPSTNTSAHGMREQRLALSISQEQFGRKLGVSFQQIKKYESGKNRVRAARLFMICKALNVSLSSMFEHDPTK
jgi:DNA-binding transcriptional regulator YiaG